MPTEMRAVRTDHEALGGNWNRIHLTFWQSICLFLLCPDTLRETEFKVMYVLICLVCGAVTAAAFSQAYSNDWDKKMQKNLQLFQKGPCNKLKKRLAL